MRIRIRGIESLETEKGEERKAEVGLGFGAFLLFTIHTTFGERGRGGRGDVGFGRGENGGGRNEMGKRGK